MKEYICIVTNENSDIRQNFVESATFHASYNEAINFGKSKCNSLKGLSDYFIYRNMSLDEIEFLDKNADESLPF